MNVSEACMFMVIYNPNETNSIKTLKVTEFFVLRIAKPRERWQAMITKASMFSLIKNEYINT